MKRLVNIVTNFSGLVRHESLEGKDYLAVPMIMMVEGVLDGSDGAFLYPGEEMAKFPQVWNHKPVVVYHPTMNGVGISACDPDVINTRKVGIIMNTKFYKDKDNGLGKLKAEAWVEVDRMNIIDNRITEAIENEAMMELSTGLFVEGDMNEGEFNGVKYAGIARNYKPDHLAILPDKEGASSIADGAGFLRLNQATKAKQDSFNKSLAEFLTKNGVTVNELSFQTIKDRLESLISGEGENYKWVIDVFDNTFIFEDNNSLYQQEYSINGDDVNLVGLPVEVQRRYEYVMVGNQKKIKIVHFEQQENTMDKKKVVKELLANGRWTKEDKDFLLNMSEEQLTHLSEQPPIKNDDDPPADALPADAPPADALPADAPPADALPADPPADTPAPTGNKAVTVEEFISKAPPEMREALIENARTHKNVRDALIVKIMSNKANTFTEDRLKVMSVENLKSTAILTKSQEVATHDETDVTGNEEFDFSGMGETVNNHTEEPLVAPTMNFSE